MNRAQCIIREVFEPSDERPVPPLIALRLGQDALHFSHQITLARGTFTTGVTYNMYTISLIYDFPQQSLDIYYTKNNDEDAQDRLIPRTAQEVKDDTKDLYQIFRAISQIIMRLRRRYTIRFLLFASPIRFAELLKQFDQLVQNIAYKLNGTIYPTSRGADAYGEVYQRYMIRLPLPGLGTRMRNRFRRR